MKKTVSLFFAVVMLLMMATTAFAAESQIPGSEDCGPHASFEGNGDLLNDNNMTRSTSLPTNYLNLAEEDYEADLQVVGKSWLYTNTYYHPNGSGKIYVDYDVTADTSTTYLYIGLYDLTKDELVVEHTAIEVRTTGKTGSMYFYNLNQSHNYAVCFRAHPASLNGSAVISH